MPFTMPLIFSTLINNMSWAIGLEITLAILGLVNLNIPTLGTMLNWAIIYQAILLGRWWWILTPVILIGLLVYCSLLAVGQHQRVSRSPNAHPAGWSIDETSHGRNR